MATSSILEKIRVNNPKAIEEYVTAMEKSADSSQPGHPSVKLCTDPASIRSILAKGTKKKTASQ